MKSLREANCRTTRLKGSCWPVTLSRRSRWVTRIRRHSRPSAISANCGNSECGSWLAFLGTLKIMEQTTQKGLIREIRRWDIVAMIINMIVGAGIFGLPSKIYSLTGTWSLLAYLICAVLVTLIIFCFSEVASRFAETGGPYLYARVAFGSVIGFEVGWLVWLARLTA